jgi:hypothetical protein
MELGHMASNVQARDVTSVGDELATLNSPLEVSKRSFLELPHILMRSFTRKENRCTVAL